MERESHKKHERKELKPASALPVSGLALVVAVFLISGLLHVGSLLELQRRSGFSKLAEASKLGERQVPVRVKIVSKKPRPPAAEDKKPAEPAPEQLLESKLSETKPPEKADFLGYQNHTALKPTKLRKKDLPTEKALDPGPSKLAAQAGQKLKTPSATSSPKLSARPEELTKQPESVKPAKKGTAIQTELQSGLPMYAPVGEERNAYERLLKQGSEGLAAQVTAGYQEYVDAEAEEGDAVDLNTQEYRYIGYFTSMRKAIELVWVYPSEAVRRGLDGKVSVRFTIEKDGLVSRVIVLGSSGHQVLDLAIVDAIRLAAPFAPLPEGLGSHHLSVTGTFNYLLH